eukprot:403363158
MTKHWHQSKLNLVIKSLPIIFVTLVLNINLSQESTTVATYSNDCIGCLLLDNQEVCDDQTVSSYSSVFCCKGMVSQTDYCNGAFTQCTNKLTTAGAKYAKCPTSSACGGTTSFFIVKGVVQEKKIQIKAKGTCSYIVYFVLADPSTTDFNYKDQPSYAQEMTSGQDLSNLYGQFVISRDTSTYPGEMRYFYSNSVGTYFNVSEGETQNVQYGVSYNLLVAANQPVLFSLKLGYNSDGASNAFVIIVNLSLLMLLSVTNILI